MGLIRRYIKPVCTAVPRIIKGYISWIKRYSINPSKYPFEKRYKKLSDICARVSKDLNVDFHFEGFEELDVNETYCFICNHLSFFDALTVLSAIKNNTSCVSKIESMKYPFVAPALKAIEGIFIPRDDLRETLKLMRIVEQDLIERKKSWLIFPEGTRSKDERLIPILFHAGTFRTPMRAKVKIVPIAIWGSDRVLQTNPVYKRYPVYAKALKPITYEQYKDMSTDDVAKYCHNEIVKCLCFDLRRKDHIEMLKINKNYKLH